MLSIGIGIKLGKETYESQWKINPHDEGSEADTTEVYYGRFLIAEPDIKLKRIDRKMRITASRANVFEIYCFYSCFSIGAFLLWNNRQFHSLVQHDGN